MTPTRIYVRALLALHRIGLLKAAAHITGGGLPGNLPRVLPQDTEAVLEPSWPIPPVFGWLARTGGITPEEMLRVFNCGVGMALVVADADTDAAIELMRAHGESVARIGRIAAGSGPAKLAHRAASRLAGVMAASDIRADPGTLCRAQGRGPQF